MGKLTISNYQEKVNFVSKEHDILSFWDETKAFETSIAIRDKNKRYVFYDGPPFATGLPHYGHILASTIKDVIPRYWTMKGYRVDRVWGWDCHGIPIENIIEKELELKGGKKGIEEMGINKFNAACRAAIFRFDKEWEQVIRRIGRWVDFKNSYKTMDKTYMESVWWAFKSLFDKGFIYEGKKVILYCPRCATPLSNFEIAMDNSYKDMSGPSTIYKYKLNEEKNTYFLAWSTTPWNKIATPALAVNPDLIYVLVRQGEEQYILAESTIGILNKEPIYSVIKKFTGKELENFSFELHYDFYPDRNSSERAGVIVSDSYVTAAEGTGIVTLAVYGEDDFRVMQRQNIQLVYHVDDEGKLKKEVTPWAGMFMLKVNPLVNEDLQKRNLIYRDEQRIHSVPVCYRCETRLYHAPVPAWFIDVQKMKDNLQKNNENIHWYPEHLKYGRFGKGIETAPDWNISRSRYWGTPMPVWKSKDSFRIIGSIEELKQWAVDPQKVVQLTDIHREFIDDIEVWIDDEKTIKGKRIPEVFDCWVESGSMPYASIHYPFEHKLEFDKSHPSQFIAEYIAQTRAWFYTLHVMSVGLFGKHTFENAVTTGTILAEDGTKMSKSKKNYPDPAGLFEKYGVDSLRFYLMGSVVMKAENLNFSEDQVREIYQKVVSLVWNTFCFYKLYSHTTNPVFPQVLKHDLDKWVVSKMFRCIADVTKAMDCYDTTTTCRLLVAIIDDVSTWYLRRSRERFKENPEYMDLFGWILLQITLLLAPMTPFISELMYQNLGQKGSVHHALWPTCDTTFINDDIEAKMETARKIVEGLLSLRKTQNIPVKQPVLSWSFRSTKDSNYFQYNPEICELISQEINSKKQQLDDATFKDWLEKKTVVGTSIATKSLGDIEVFIDTEVTPEISLERKVREFVRAIQIFRKENKCKVQEHIALVAPSEYSVIPDTILEKVKRDTLISSLVWGDSFSLLTG